MEKKKERRSDNAVIFVVSVADVSVDGAGVSAGASVMIECSVYLLFQLGRIMEWSVGSALHVHQIDDRF